MPEHNAFILRFKRLPGIGLGRAIFDDRKYELILVHLIENKLVEIVRLIGFQDHREMISIPNVT